MKEIKDLKLKDSKELEKLDNEWMKTEYKDAKKKIFTLRMKLELSELKQTHLIKALRKYIAKIKTLSNNKQYNID